MVASPPTTAHAHKSTALSGFSELQSTTSKAMKLREICVGKDLETVERENGGRVVWPTLLVSIVTA